MNFSRFPFNLAKAFLLRRSRRWQMQSPLRDLRWWDLDVNEAGHLAVAGLDVPELTRHYGSPLLVVHGEQLRRDTRAIQRALSAHAPVGSRVLYSYKTNCIPGILTEMHDMQVGAEVI